MYWSPVTKSSSYYVSTGECAETGIQINKDYLAETSAASFLFVINVHSFVGTFFPLTYFPTIGKILAIKSEEKKSKDINGE